MKKALSLLVVLLMSIENVFSWTHVQSASNGGFTSQSSGGVSFGASATSGNLVICHWYFQSTTVTLNSVQDAGGDSVWTIRGPITGSNNRSYIAEAVVVTAFSSPSGNFSGATTGDVLCTEFSGNAAAGSHFDCVSSGSSGNGTALDGGTCTPTASDDLFIGAGGTMANNVTYTAGTGYTIRVNEAHSTLGNSVALETKTSSSCSAQSADMTGNVSGEWNMITVAYKSNSPSACSSKSISTSPGTGSITTTPGSGSIVTVR